MPPAWLPFAAVAAVIAVSVVRMLSVQRKHGVKAYGFGRRPEIQRVAERNWRLAVAATLATTVIAWLKPEWEAVLGRPAWAATAALRWAAALVLIASVALIAAAQIQMGASWRIGVPKEGPGALVAHGTFRWSRNPIFIGMLGVLAGICLWSPHIVSSAVLGAAWMLVPIQVRVEEEALRERHGSSYDRHTDEVPRWFGWQSKGGGS